jgi:hypothetical protein
MYIVDGFNPSELTQEELSDWNKHKLGRISSGQYQRHIVEKRNLQRTIRYHQIQINKHSLNVPPGVAAHYALGVAAHFSAEILADHQVFNCHQGHGYAAERLNNQHDLELGRDSRIVGGNNLKNGPDRMVDGVLIQTKYCQSAKATFSELFSDGFYRYLNADGTAMACEVPRDQYPEVLEKMAEAITEGRVANESDPLRAKDLVKEGHYTYAQAANTALPGNWDSLKYDFKTGIVSCSFAAGISAAITYAWYRRNGSSEIEALEKALQTSLEVFGLTLTSHVITLQLGRTVLSQWLNRPSVALTKLTPHPQRSFLAAGMRGCNTNNPTSVVLKAFKGHVIATGITTAILSIKDTVRLCNGEISKIQFYKNVMVTGGTVVGGSLGSWLGKSLAILFLGPIVWGPFAGVIIGGLVGSEIGRSTTKCIMDEIADDDVIELQKIFTKQFEKVVTNFMLTHAEIRDVVNSLQKRNWRDFFYVMHASVCKEKYAEKWCEDLCGPIISERKPI